MFEIAIRRKLSALRSLFLYISDLSLSLVWGETVRVEGLVLLLIVSTRKFLLPNRIDHYVLV